MPYLGSTPNASFSSRTKQDFTANGSTTAFTLSSAVASANDIEVFVGNVRQEPTDAYTVNGTTLTMSEAPETGLNFYVVFKGLEENSVVPADNAISTAKIANDAVTGAKIENNPTIAGNLTVSGTTTATGLITASGGIAIGGTDSAHTLDDYEEGFHDATFAMNGSGSVTMSRSKIGYTKIGRMVTCTGEVTVGSTSSPVGSMTMSLPFVIANQLSNQRDAFFGFTPTAYHVPFSGGIPPKGIGNGQVSSVTFVYEQHDAAFASYVPYANDTFNFSFSYFTN
jgi:hypothetical protein